MRRWLIGWFFWALPFLAAAQGSDPLAPLRAAILKADWPAAEAQLASLAGRIDVDPNDLVFLTGMTALGQQQYDRAITQFRRMLDRDPTLARVRLELARALFLKRDDDAARYHFELALAGKLPETVERNVRGFLTEIRRRRLWSFEVSGGVLPDSNINAGSNQQTVNIAGLPFTLSSEAREKSGFGAMISMNASRAIPLTAQWQLRGFASVLRRDYTDSRFDDMILRVGLGPRRVFANGEFGLAPFSAERRFGNDILNRSDGLRLDGIAQVSARDILEGVVEWQRFVYPDRPGRDGDVLWAYLGGRFLVDAGTQLTYGADTYDERAEDPSFRNLSLAYSLGVLRDWPRGVSTALTMRRARTEFDGIQPLFGEYRNERLTTWTLTVTKRDWTLFEFAPALSVTNYRNVSSIPFYGFDRTQVLLAFTRRL